MSNFKARNRFLFIYLFTNSNIIKQYQKYYFMQTDKLICTSTVTGFVVNSLTRSTKQRGNFFIMPRSCNLEALCFTSALKCSLPPRESANGCRWRKCLTLWTQQCLFQRSWSCGLPQEATQYPLNVTQTPQPTPGGFRNCPLWGN